MDREIAGVLKKKKNQKTQKPWTECIPIGNCSDFTRVSKLSRDCTEQIKSTRKLKTQCVQRRLSYYFGSFTPEFLSNSALIRGQTSSLTCHFLQRHTVVLGCDFLVGGAAVTSSFSWGSFFTWQRTNSYKTYKAAPYMHGKNTIADRTVFHRGTGQ